MLENEKNEFLDLKNSILKMGLHNDLSTSDNRIGSEKLVELFKRYLDNKGSKIDDFKHFEILVKKFNISPIELANFLSFSENTLRYRYNNTNYIIGRKERSGIFKSGDIFNFKFYLENSKKNAFPLHSDILEENEKIIIKEFEFSNIPHTVSYSSDSRYNNTLLKPNVHYFHVNIKDLTKG